MANNQFIGETSGKYWKQKNDETYVNEDELVKITDLNEDETVDDDDLLIKGNASTGTMLRIKVANFLDGIKEKLLGSTDISSVGDGTVTGAISTNAQNIATNKDDADSKYTELSSALAAKQNTLSTYGWQMVDNLSISSGETSNVNYGFPDSNYTYLGIIGYRVYAASSSGSGHSSANVYSVRITSSGVEVAIRNISSNDIKIAITVYLLRTT